MYETTRFESQKLTACILAALKWPNDNQSLVDAWRENGAIVHGLIYRILRKQERATTERILEAQPDEVQRLKDILAREY